jgi:hypothetical protein
MIELDYLIEELYNRNRIIKNNNNRELIKYHQLDWIMYEEKKLNHRNQNFE